MIGRLTGEIVHKQPPFLMLEVNGVGYELEAPMSTFYDLPAIGERTTLLTHLVVREDAHILYAFTADAERTLFRTLLKVTGVGAKMALAILSGMNASQFARCVQHQDAASLTRLPGIGKKTAERLIVELRDRVDRIEGAGGGVRLPANAPAAVRAEDPAGDAIDALVALGYKPQDAQRMVRGVAADGMSSEQLIREALKRSVS